VLLACYFANLSLWLHSDNQQLSIKSFEDLANQNLIEYGTIKDSSSFAFFKVRHRISLIQYNNLILTYKMIIIIVINL